ncbi:MAG: MATE family efflux transporter [Akkermansiaceae bacterium]|jgi:putative MATE family efflux protein|nr:MATE family efflux transporter [Akkermansiaceae bacterium]MDP4779099.1 MATE family efflux transporter [Akkermansiaceae bacterium]
MSKPGISVEASERGEEIRLGGKLGGMSLRKQVLTLAMWPLMEQVLAFFVGMTDIFIAGHMVEGAERVAVLDAMGLGGYVGWFINIFQGAVATGVMALVSRATGARDEPLANRGLGQGLWLGTAAGLVAFFALEYGGIHLIQWMGLTPAAAVEAKTYIGMLAWTGPVAGGMFAVNAALRGSGDTRTPFMAMLVVNVVNMACSVLLVFGPEPFGGMGVKGIALGTVIGWAAGLVTVVVMLALKKREGLKWTRRGLAFHGETVMRIWRVGVPQAFEIAGMWTIHSFGIRVISGLAEEGALGAHFIAIRLESMSFLPGFAIAAAASALTGQYLGAGSKEMAVKVVRFCWKFAVILMGVMGVFFVVAREWLIGVMAPGSVVHLDLAAPLLVVCAFTQPLFATCMILKTTMRGAGATKMVMRAAFGSMLFSRVLVLGVLAHFGWISLTGVWIVFGFDLLTQAIIFIRRHFRGKWLDAKV